MGSTEVEELQEVPLRDDPPPDLGEETADGPDAAFGEVEADDDETPDDGEPDGDD